MAFSNLAIAFGVKSDDAREEISVLDETLQSIDDKLGDIKGMEAFSGLVEALNLNVLDDLKGKLDGIGDELDGNVDLSGKLDSVFAEANKSMQKLSASANLSQEEMSRFRQETSFFESLQMDAESVQQTWLRLHDAGLDVTNLGFENFKEFMKFTEVSGVEGPKMVRMLEMMQKQFNMTGEESKALVDDVLQVGRTFDVGSSFIQEMPEHIQAVQKHFAQLESVQAEHVPGITRGTFQLAGALEETLGTSSEKALGMATETFEQMSEQSLNIQGVMKGVDQEISDGVRDNLIALGKMDPGKNPLEYVRQLQRSYSQAGGHVQQVIRQQLPPAMQAALDMNQKFGANLQKGAEAMKNSAGAANELADAHRTGRTTQERYDRQQMLFNQNIRDMSRNLGVTGDLLEQQGNAFDMIEGKLKKYVNLGKEGESVTNMFGMKLQDAEGNMTGMGKATKAATEAFIGYKTAGLRGATIAVVNLAEKHGFLSDKLAENKSAFAGMMSTVLGGLPEIMTMIATMNVAGIGGMGILSPLMPAVLIGGGLVALEQTWKGGITGFFDDIEGFLKEKTPELREQLSTWLREGMASVPGIVEGLGDAVGPLVDNLTTFFDNNVPILRDRLGTWFNRSVDALPGILSKGGDMLEPLVSGLINLIEQIDWSQVGSVLMTGLTNLFAFVGREIVPPAIGMLTDVMSGVIGGVSDFIRAPGSSPFQSMKRAGTVLMGALATGLYVAPGLTGGILRNVAGGLKNIFKAGASGGGGVMGGLKAVGKRLVVIQAAVVGVTSALETLRLVTTAWEGDVEKTEETAENTFMNILDTIDMVSLGIISSLGGALGVTRGHVKAFYHFTVGQFSKTIDWIATSFSLIPELTSYTWNQIQSGFNSMMATIIGKAAEGFKAIRKPVQSFVGFLKLSFASISMVVKTIATTLVSPFQTAFVKLVSFFKSAIGIANRLAKKLPGVGGLPSGMMKAVNNIDIGDLKFADKMGLSYEERRKEADKIKEMAKTARQDGYSALSSLEAGREMDEWAKSWRESAKAQAKQSAPAGRKIDKAFEGVRRRSKMADREMQKDIGEALMEGAEEGAKEGEEEKRTKKRQQAVPDTGDIKIDQPSHPSQRGRGQTDVGMATAAINRDGFKTMSSKLDKLVTLMKRNVEKRQKTLPRKGQSGSENINF